MILSGSFVQMKGFGLALVSARKRWIACLSSWIERKTPRLRRRLVKGGEQAFDSIEPGCRGRDEVEDKAGVASEPFQDFGMLVRGVVVDDDVDGLLWGHSGVDDVQETNELLMAMALHTPTD